MTAPRNGDSHTSVLARRRITLDGLAGLRSITVASAHDAGLGTHRADNFALAVNEVATNTIKYANSSGYLTVTRDDRRRLYADIADHGPGIRSTPPGLPRPPNDALGGRGLWLSRQMCDRVDVRTDASGTTVRLEMDLDRS